eukprot:TRINITY_DN430_c0_g1_i2.p1 TRINITY_DN430_c0_g1~~TRINITY_DN430_c0_g1_i2.p1  ORF type:complete len:111 (+),score=23.06 TRINITY_DN430_c0_g1_i2:435-767(+)
MRAYRESSGAIVDNVSIKVDFERERLNKGWIPRRLGGGLGGNKKSGQLRFGGRYRPFRKPIKIKEEHPPNIKADLHTGKIGVVADVSDIGDSRLFYLRMGPKGVTKKRVH